MNLSYLWEADIAYVPRPREHVDPSRPLRRILRESVVAFATRLFAEFNVLQCEVLSGARGVPFRDSVVRAPRGVASSSLGRLPPYNSSVSHGLTRSAVFSSPKRSSTPRNLKVE